MGLRDQLRKIERKTSLAAQPQIDHAGKEWADTERRLRQKMRIYPDKRVSSQAAGLRLPVGGRAAGQLRDPEAGVARKAIVSIHGRDVNDDGEDNECGHLIQSR